MENNNLGKNNKVEVIAIYSQSFLKKVTLCLLFVLVVSYLIINNMLLNIKQDLVEENQRQMLATTDYVDSVLLSCLNSADKTVKALTVLQPRSAKINDYLKEIVKDYPSISHIHLINKNGLVTESSRADWVGLNVKKKLYFQQVMKTGQPYISNIYDSMTVKDRVISIALPIKERGKTVGVLNTVFKLSYLQNNLKQFIRQEDEGMVISIIDGNGIVIYSSNTKHILTDISGFPAVRQALAGKVGTAEYFAPMLQQWRFFSFSPLQKAHWGIIVSQPSKRVYELVSYIALRFTIIVFLLLTPIFLFFSHLFKLEKMREMEIAEMQKEKTRTVSELAASVAHEIRNPLTSIRGFVQLLAKRDLSEKGVSYTKIIIDEIDRLEGIIGEFLSFTKNRNDKKEKCDLRKVLKTTYYLAEGRGSHSQVKVILDTPVSVMINGNMSQLQQAFINFCINSIQAMPQGGILEIKLLEENSKGVVIFSDIGCGMPPEALKRLGEPYFSTKEEGTGLGMAVSYRILKNHGAAILVSSQLEKGTTFRIEFPLLE